jgi:prevent-host-death family protein
MRKISIASLRDQLAKCCNEIAYGQERYVVTYHGKPLVAIISMEDFARLEKRGVAADQSRLKIKDGEAAGPFVLRAVLADIAAAEGVASEASTSTLGAELKAVSTSLKAIQATEGAQTDVERVRANRRPQINAPKGR